MSEFTIPPRWALERAEDAKRINEDEHRLITMDDLRAIMVRRFEVPA